MPFDRELVEAKLRLELIASEDMPNMAQDALEAGFDGAAIRRLAILEHPTFFEVHEVLPRVIQELQLKEISNGEAAQRVARQRVREILQNDGDLFANLRELELLWARTNYAREIGPLGTLYDDVWIRQASGDSEKQIREWVLEELKNFLKPENA